MKQIAAPVTLGELIRLALPSNAEFIGADEQRARIVKWAVVATAALPMFDFEADDVVLLPADEDVPPLIGHLAQTGTAAVITIGHVPEDALAAARSAAPVSPRWAATPRAPWIESLAASAAPAGSPATSPSITRW